MKDKLNIKVNSALKNRDEIPNKTTLDAYKEVENMEINLNNYKTYNSVDLLMKDLLD